MSERTTPDLAAVSDEELVEKVQTFVRHFVPDAVCELQDYGFRIGCGSMGHDGVLHEEVFLKRELTAERVEYHAKMLLKKRHP